MTLITQETARSIVKAIGDDSRAAIIARARTLRERIAQTFADAEHWNRVNVPSRGPAIDPDPDGQLKRIADCVDRMLAKEPLRCDGCGGTISPLDRLCAL